ncbi:MAG: hypothetical protein AAF436_10985 [Myxococcota bacterium]
MSILVFVLVDGANAKPPDEDETPRLGEAAWLTQAYCGAHKGKYTHEKTNSGASTLYKCSFRDGSYWRVKSDRALPEVLALETFRPIKNREAFERVLRDATGVPGNIGRPCRAGQQRKVSCQAFHAKRSAEEVGLKNGYKGVHVYRYQELVWSEKRRSGHLYEFERLGTEESVRAAMAGDDSRLKLQW